MEGQILIGAVYVKVSDKKNPNTGEPYVNVYIGGDEVFVEEGVPVPTNGEIVRARCTSFWSKKKERRYKWVKGWEPVTGASDNGV